MPLLTNGFWATLYQQLRYSFTCDMLLNVCVYKMLLRYVHKGVDVARSHIDHWQEFELTKRHLFSSGSSSYFNIINGKRVYEQYAFAVLYFIYVQFISRTIRAVADLLYFVVIRKLLISPISFWIISLLRRQSYCCHITENRALNDMSNCFMGPQIADDIITWYWITQSNNLTKQNRINRVYIDYIHAYRWLSARLR